MNKIHCNWTKRKLDDSKRSYIGSVSHMFLGYSHKHSIKLLSKPAHLKVPRPSSSHSGQVRRTSYR